MQHLLEEVRRLRSEGQQNITMNINIGNVTTSIVITNDEDNIKDCHIDSLDDKLQTLSGNIWHIYNNEQHTQRMKCGKSR